MNLFTQIADVEKDLQLSQHPPAYIPQDGYQILKAALMAPPAWSARGLATHPL